MPLLSVNVFGPGDTSNLISIFFIYICYAAPPYSAHISAIYLRFRKVWLGYVCRVQRLATKQNAEFTKC